MNALVDKDLDNITTGNTIYLKINPPTTFKDLETGKEVDYSKAENLGMVFTLLRFIDENSTVSAIKDFVSYIAKYKLTRNIKIPRFFEISNPINLKISMFQKAECFDSDQTFAFSQGSHKPIPLIKSNI